jgi:hypothetical protein
VHRTVAIAQARMQMNPDRSSGQRWEPT